MWDRRLLDHHGARCGNEGPLMRKLVRLGAVIIGTVGLSIAGAAAAYANWTVRTAPLVLNVKIITMPVFYSAPAVQPQGRKVTVSWASGKRKQICTTSITTCRDTAVPDGAWAYTVQTVYASWRGVDSPPSAPVKIGNTATPPSTPTATTEAAATAPQPPMLTTAPSGPPQSHQWSPALRRLCPTLPSWMRRHLHRPRRIPQLPAKRPH